MAPSKNRKFVVQMYESEYRQIQGWVAKHQHVETGGDLFGLWAEDNTTVVQLVLGPGKHCRRSSVSFYQDVDYLERVGNILTTEEGLCHIGEWHSHHQLGLSRPSGGDENTVWTNMDRYGINRFFLFIATIGSSYNDVNVGCFLFEINQNTKRREPVLKGEIHLFGNEESPFRKSVKDHLAKGAESQNSSQYLKKFQSNVIKTHERASTDTRLWRDYDEQDHKKLKIHNTAECHTPVITIDQVMEESNVNKVDHHQEDKSEDMKDKDTKKSGKLSQEEENQGNKLGLHVDEQSNLTQDDNKPETLKNQPSSPATVTEKNKHPSSSAKTNSKVTYLGGGFKNSQVQEKHEALHAEESKDGQATEETSSKNIIQHPKPNTIHVKPASEESNTNQGQPSNALDQNKNTTIEDGSELKGPEDELKDAQQNYIKQSSATEETKIDETRKLLPVKDSKSGRFPKKKKKAEEMKEKKERKEKKNKEKEEKKKKIEEKIEKKNKEKEEKKKEKKERKEKKKEEKKKKKREEKIEKKNKEEEEKKKKIEEKIEKKNKEEEEKKKKIQEKIEKKNKEEEEKKKEMEEKTEKKNKEEDEKKKKKENKNKAEKDKKAKNKGKKESSKSTLMITSV